MRPQEASVTPGCAQELTRDGGGGTQSPILRGHTGCGLDALPVWLPHPNVGRTHRLGRHYLLFPKAASCKPSAQAMEVL